MAFWMIDVDYLNVSHFRFGFIKKESRSVKVLKLKWILLTNGITFWDLRERNDDEIEPIPSISEVSKRC
jgi:hypothetical protein